MVYMVYWTVNAVGVRYSPFTDQHPSNHVTSLSFSSENGGKSILAVGRQSGTLSLWSTFESQIRFEVSHPDSITCVAFKQTKSRKLSERFQGMEVETEDLAVGDDLGYIWYYSVEWPEGKLRRESHWNGAMTLVAKISAHVQQICGVSWSPDGTYFATGGNDNSCLIFDLPDIIPPRGFPGPHKVLGIGRKSTFSVSEASPNERHSNEEEASSVSVRAQHSIGPPPKALINRIGTVISGRGRTVIVPPNRQKHRLVHSAAVKAIAFAPWQSSLLATGGGSNDRAIHFFHTPSGACLATINVYAQVTSLIWSKTRREIVATFGFAQPEHPFRIAVFAWPSCKQISAIPWGPYGSSWESMENDSAIDCGRALYAVSYPGRPRNCAFNDVDDPYDSSTSELEASRQRHGMAYGRTVVRPRAKEGGLWCSRTVEEGCIIIASSDQTVKFHEVWSSSTRRHGIDVIGAYGGSEILEGLEGLEKSGDEIIR
ncbi:hypothetical protein FE257_009256 [Aspergillus nanangensis]|uniref:WD40 repeat-like protein n=1 Tax=Aspergillus nanangensis TaxID=2582783 RepID=A0AAD4CKC6_ASPNN|nr:hypothetical protein FE257_009256 [Aspergillus nanangensis]